MFIVQFAGINQTDPICDVAVGSMTETESLFYTLSSCPNILYVSCRALGLNYYKEEELPELPKKSTPP